MHTLGIKRQPTFYVLSASAATAALAVILTLLLQGASAQNPQPRREDDLIQPLACSALKNEPVPPELKGLCEITLDKKGKTVKVILKAQTSKITVGGYTVETENFNGNYLPPVIKAAPGDTVSARLENVLKDRPIIDHQPAAEPSAAAAPTQAAPTPHAHEKGNPTNLHYFHGGVVTPRNARSQADPDASKGDGDNVYVTLMNGPDEPGKRPTKEYNVPIPKRLHAGVLEGTTAIPHPNGLNWYHSHMHGRSSDQVMGGLSGLLSVGEDKANVWAKCAKDTPPEKCTRDTDDLRKKTTVRYALLRDITLRGIAASALPEDAVAGKTAIWAPEDREFHPDLEPLRLQLPPEKRDLQLPHKCEVYKREGSQLRPYGDPDLRKGFCQRSPESAWLFTLNGQRYPTILIQGGQNLLLRIGNLSANVAYWLELRNREGKTRPLTILSVDGVVPARPVSPGVGATIDAIEVDDLLLMPASRAEIYIRNDSDKDTPQQVYVLRAKELDVGTDRWPAIQLAEVVLGPNKVASKIALARNAPQQAPSPVAAAKLAAKPEEVALPESCVRDLEKGEHRRVTFRNNGKTSAGRHTKWSITTEIRMPPPGSGPFVEDTFTADTKHRLQNVPFEEYIKEDDGTVDWDKRHVCIRLDDAEHSPSRKQLWVLRNVSDSLHNFHIHQMKFRLATKTELEKIYKIIPPEQASTCPEKNCSEPDYKLYEKDPPPGTLSYPVWHDTIPVPLGKRVYIVMSFTAEEQIGRYVFHCHILKHEDTGLMAPMEVLRRYKK